MHPPKITDGINPSSFAATPDSKEPISLDDPIKIAFTEATRPRISSGVISCIAVDLIITLMLSNIPLSMRRASDR